jgi:hypothetical protein
MGRTRPGTCVGGKLYDLQLDGGEAVGGLDLGDDGAMCSRKAVENSSCCASGSSGRASVGGVGGGLDW